MLGRHMHARMCRALERVGALVELDGDGAVVHLVRDGERGVVVVRRAHEPQAVGHDDLAVVQPLRVARPCGGHQVKHLLVQAPDFAIRRLVAGVVVLQLVVDAPPVHTNEHNQHGHRNKQGKQDNGTDFAHNVERIEVRLEYAEIVQPAEYQQVQNRAENGGNVVHNLRQQLSGKPQKLAH